MLEGAGTATAAVRAVSERSGDLQALGGVDFDLRSGEIHALVSENGPVRRR